LKQINTDLNAGNQSAVNADLAQLQATLNAVDFDALTGSAAFAPEGGFAAAPSALPGFGINPTAADANVGPYLSNLISALQNLTSFLQTTPLATLTPAQQTTYTQLQSTLSTLVGQLPSLNPSTYGVVANMSQEDFLFAQVLPQYYQALAQATIQLLTANGFTASVRPRHRKGHLFAEDGSVDIIPVGWRPGDVQFVKTGLHSLRHGRGPGMAFQFGGVAEIELVCDIQMDLIKNIYGPYFKYLAQAAVTIILNGAVQDWLGGQSLVAVDTGGDTNSFLEFYDGPSDIEGLNFDPIYQNNQVYLIGPDQINGVTGLVTNVTNFVNGLVKKPPKDNNAANKALNTFKGFFATAKCLFGEATQPTNTGQGPGNCINDFGDPACIELDYPNGFNTVFQGEGGGLPAGVIILVWNVPSGAFSIGPSSYSFFAAAAQPPQMACP